MAYIVAESRRVGKSNIHYICNITMGLFMAQCGVSGSLKTHNRSKSSWSRSSKRRSSSNSRRSNENKSSGHYVMLIVDV